MAPYLTALVAMLVEGERHDLHAFAVQLYYRSDDLDLVGRTVACGVQLHFHHVSERHRVARRARQETLHPGDSGKPRVVVVPLRRWCDGAPGHVAHNGQQVARAVLQLCQQHLLFALQALQVVDVRGGAQPLHNHTLCPVRSQRIPHRHGTGAMPKPDPVRYALHSALHIQPAVQPRLFPGLHRG